MIRLTELSLFQTANIFLGLILVVLFIRYIWYVYFRRNDTPASWVIAVKTGQVQAGLKKLERGYRDRQRFFAWWLQVERLRRENVPGAFVELGVYKGESAAILHAMDPRRPFHLFDTFTGFPLSDLRVETGEAATYTPDHFADTSVQSVLKKIGDNSNIFLHQGYFPDTARGFSGPVALVNMDLDLYMPTRAGLELFYQMLSPGGVILIHDYHYKWPGIIRAVNEFAATIPECPVYMPDADGTVVIVRNRLP